MTIQSIALDKLYISPANVRKTGTKDGIEGLANSIHTHGLLQNLTVQPGGESNTFSVLAGGRRLLALQFLAKQKKLAADWPVPCNVIEIEGDIGSEEISLAENEMRAAMHPADQFEAFKKLADEGQGIETIAAKFGVTPRVVEQRLKLAKVSPKLIKIYREGGMCLEQIMAFSLTTDQKQQEKIWNNLPKYAKEQQRDDTIRAAITNKHIPADNDIAAFVGIEAYEAAGGQVLRDLFCEDDESAAYLANVELLNKLAGEKLEQLAETVRAEGWKWVIVTPDLSWEEQRKYTRSEGTPSKKLSGAIVTIEDGKAHILRGLMKPEDARAAKKAKTVKAKDGAKKSTEDKSLSAALVQSLTAHRTAEMQAQLIDNPKPALIGIAHALVQTVTVGYADSPFQITGTRETLRDEAAAKSAASKTVADAIKELQKSAPDDPVKLWVWLTKKDQKELLDILAVCAAATFDAVLWHEPSSDGDDISAPVAAAIKFDMAKHWQATAASYFDRVSSAQIIAAVTEACGKAEAAKLAGMKKGAMAKGAEKALKGKGWLPAILRTAS